MPTSLNADQSILFARAVGLEVSLLPSVLLKSFFLRALGTGNLGVRGQQGRFLFLCAVESFVGDGLASQSRYSSPTGSVSTPTFAADGTV